MGWEKNNDTDLRRTNINTLGKSILLLQHLCTNPINVIIIITYCKCIFSLVLKLLKPEGDQSLGEFSVLIQTEMKSVPYGAGKKFLVDAHINFVCDKFLVNLSVTSITKLMKKFIIICI